MPEIEAATETTERATRQKDVVRVGIIGYGTVGRSSDEILASHAGEITQRLGGVSIVVKRICRKSPKASEAGVSGVRVVADWREVATADDVDIVIEAIGGTTTAEE